MTVRRIALAALALILMIGLAANLTEAQTDANMNFLSASATCTQGAFTIQTEGIIPDLTGRGPTVAGANNTSVEAWDSTNTFLGAKDFVTSFYDPGTYSDVIPFSSEPVGPVTFRLYYDSGFFGQFLRGKQAEPGDTLADTITVPVNCGVEAAAPGCDQLISLTGAVVALFVSDSPAFWEPNSNSPTIPPTIIPEGKTLYMFGVDQSGQFAKVLLGCTFLWVPRGSVAPNPDDVWHSTPLPTTVVR